MRRGPKKRLRQDEKFTITLIGDDGQPIEPKATKDAFSAQCGAIVRDIIPISIQQWNKPAKNKDPQVSYVTDRQKDDLWTSLKANFTLPPEEDVGERSMQFQKNSYAHARSIHGDASLRERECVYIHS